MNAFPCNGMFSSFKNSMANDVSVHTSLYVLITIWKYHVKSGGHPKRNRQIFIVHTQKK